ncbi:MAG: ECF transporter S component [Clostridia bacterium]|nr:ECF transporter S component [Clostridia bacterium]
MQLKVSRREQTKRLTELGVLIALEIIIAFTPLGTIQVGTIAATLGHIPVIIAAIVLGTAEGAFMGFVFGLLSFLYWTFVQPMNPTAFMFTPFCQLGEIRGSAWSLLICFVPRILIGVVAGEVCKLVKRTTNRDGLAYGLAGAAGSAVTTILVLGLTYLLIGRPYVAAVFQGGTAPENAMAWLLAAIGGVILTNGIPELIVGAIAAIGIGYALVPRRLVLGIDIGSSTTKIALLRGDHVEWTKRIENGGDLEAELRQLNLTRVKKVCVTGVGASYITGDLCGIPTERVEEFRALGKGAALIAKKRNLIVCSVGTGTSFVRVTPFSSFHIGGSGIGGGMLKGLSEKLFGRFDAAHIAELAKAGALGDIDLTLADVCEGTISNLRPETTVANLAKAGTASDEALAHGLYNVIFQSIGVMAAFAAKHHFVRTIFVCGTILEHGTLAKDALESVATLHKVKFILPEQAAFVTAIGAAQLG